MKAFVLRRIHNLDTLSEPLELINVANPVPAKGEILIKISCCGVCHTELDEIEGRTPPPTFPVIPGHQVIGTIEALGEYTKRFKIGNRVGAAWIFSSCGKCALCSKGLENLCANFKATGRDANGGYAEYMTVSENYAYLIPELFTDVEAAPLLCAGAIGYRSLKLSGITNGRNLGLMGFGASGHLVLKMTRYLYPASKIFVFTRNANERNFALSLGAAWAGDISDIAPAGVDVIIDTTPAWRPVLEALRLLEPGGRLVINAIRKEDKGKSVLFDLNYQNHLWMEKEIKSVANITRTDVEEFLKLAATIPIKSEVQVYPFEQANVALLDLKYKSVKGAKVLSF